LAQRPPFVRIDVGLGLRHRGRLGDGHRPLAPHRRQHGERGERGRSCARLRRALTNGLPCFVGATAVHRHRNPRRAVPQHDGDLLVDEARLAEQTRRRMPEVVETQVPELDLRSRDLHRSQRVPATRLAAVTGHEHERVGADAVEALASLPVTVCAELGRERGGHRHDPVAGDRLDVDERACVTAEPRSADFRPRGLAGSTCRATGPKSTGRVSPTAPPVRGPDDHN
jgi:hypothetical protein